MSRLLPETARHVVLNMLWYERDVRYEDVACWVRERRSDSGPGGEHKCVLFPFLPPSSSRTL